MSKINFRITECEPIDEEKTSGFCVRVVGYKMAPPSKRITFRQKNIKILNANITFKHKKGDIEVEVKRINHLKSFGEVRIHTKSIMYPGVYEIILEYSGNMDFCQPFADD